jgi:ribosomal protein S18 acetylase RimI-like enzyme
LAASTTDIITLARPLNLADAPPVWPDGVRPTPFRVADASDIHALVVRAYGNGYGTVQPDWLDWFEWLTTDPEFDQKLCLIARAGASNEIVGFCLVWTSAFVKDLVVEPAWHGRGVGTALLATAIAEMHQRGATHLRLKVDARNLGARRFYERMGFAPD